MSYSTVIHSPVFSDKSSSLPMPRPVASHLFPCHEVCHFPLWKSNDRRCPLLTIAFSYSILRLVSQRADFVRGKSVLRDGCFIWRAHLDLNRSSGATEGKRESTWMSIQERRRPGNPGPRTVGQGLSGPKMISLFRRKNVLPLYEGRMQTASLKQGFQQTLKTACAVRFV